MRKVHAHNGFEERKQEFEMYDLSQDANETQNLYRDPRYADVQRRLWSRMQELEAAIPERPKIEAARKNA